VTNKVQGKRTRAEVEESQITLH